MGTKDVLTKRTGLWLLVAVLLSLALHAGITRGVLGQTVDGTVYLGTARVLTQHGVLASEYAFSERLVRRGNPEARPAEPGELEGRPQALHPLTAWAPAYSVAVGALMVAAGLADGTAAFWVNAAALVGLVVLSGLLGRRVAASDSGLFVGVAAGLMPCVMVMACFAASETLFLCLMLLSLWSLSRWAERPDSRLGDCLLAAVAAAAATYTRYIGFTLAVTLGLTVLGAFARHRRPRALLAGLAAGALYTLLVLPMALRNVRLTGFVGGAERLPATRSVLENVRDALVSLLSLGPLPPVSEHPGFLVASSVLFWGYVLVLVRWPGRGDTAALAEDTGPTRRVLWLFTGLYAAVLIAIESHTEIDSITFRLMAPALLCLLVLAVGSAARRASFERTRLATLVFGAMCAVASFAGALSVMPGWRFFRDPSYQQTPLARRVLQDILPGMEAGTTTLFTDAIPSVYGLVRRPLHWWPSPRSLPALVAGAGEGTLVFLRAGNGYFPCKEYSAAYERVLERFAVRSERERTYRIWWLRREPTRASELEQAIAEVRPELCGQRPEGRPGIATQGE